jgi:predicted secreted hydrolase
MRRRSFLASPLLLVAAAARAADYPPVVAGVPLVFPRDHGSHPAFRVEWWYVTGWLRDDGGTDYGFQVTFFRLRPGIAESNPSAFAPRQLLFAHAALADVRLGRLRHDQRAARAGFGLAEAATATTDLRIEDWSLALDGGVYAARVAARDFTLALTLTPTQAPLPEGEGGYSRKGPEPRQASYYYSVPQLAVAGRIALGDRAAPVTGTAWLDHEWSSELMAPAAVGWDWAGINLDDGGALMAFRMRDRAGSALWAGAARRAADGATRVFAPAEVRFAPQRRWRSPRTGTEYPVAMDVTVGSETCALAPLIDDQELDARGTTGTLYWEGAVRARSGGRAVGKGYLELTGYASPLRL